MSQAQQQKVPSSGVEELISKLRQEGVQAGQQQAEEIIADARKQAAAILADAQHSATTMLSQARQEADSINNAAQDALKLAARDAMLKLRDSLLASFSEEVGRVVGVQMTDREFMAKLILALAGQIREQSGLDASNNLILEIPEKLSAIDLLKKKPEELQEGTLTHLTAAIAAEMLRKGVTLGSSREISGGVFIKLIDEEMVIDFSESAVASLLLEHMQPRFRALLQGIVR